MSSKVKIPVQLSIKLTGNPENGIIRASEGFKIQVNGTYENGLLDVNIIIDDTINITEEAFFKIKDIQDKRG